MGLLPGGCRQQASTEPNSVSSVAERGPFTFTIEATPKQAWVGDPVTVELRVATPDGYVVQFPDEASFGEIDAGRVETADPHPGVEGGLLWRQTVTLEPLISGTVSIPALTVRYAHKPAQPDAEPLFEHELVTEPLQIQVRSALTTRDSVLKPRDITGTLTPPKEPLSAWAWATIIGGALIALLAIAALAVWLRKRARRPAPPILPEVWALRALADLEAADLIESGQAKDFYYSLTEIVRVYIERKFGLAAPEMTTEEFLTTLARNRGALPYDPEKLSEFLRAGDLVKYAALIPRKPDAEQALRTARAFVDTTAAAAQRGRQDTLAPDARKERGGYAA